MTTAERRKNIRRISDDCAQCDVWDTKISALECQSKTHVSKWTFILVIAAYLGLAGWNAITIRSNAEATQRKFDEISDKMTELVVKAETGNTRLLSVEKAVSDLRK